MYRSFAFVFVLMAGAVGAPSTWAQTGAAEPEPPPAESAVQPGTEPPADSNTFENIRETIVDQRQSLDSRRTAAELLVKDDSPQAKQFTAELLRFTEDPQTQTLVCAALADHVRGGADGLDPLFVEPLLGLCGAERAELRAQAAEALALSSEPRVARKLSDLAEDGGVALPIRLAAIDALAAHIDRSEVVAGLIRLLGGGESRIDERLVAVLTQFTNEPFGDDLVRWRAWWSAESSDWTAYRLRYYRERARRIGRQFDEFRAVSDEERQALRVRLAEMEREHFRVLSPEAREVKLAQWLREPLAVLRRTALRIITGRMGDEGYRPAGDVLAALLQLLEDPSVEMRQEVLRIVENLHDPSTIGSVLSRLPRETDIATRRAIFRALGELGAVEAIPVLVEEIRAEETDPSCVRDAAIALGQLAAKAGDTAKVAIAVGPLNQRYATVEEGDPELTAALLRAMVGVADPSFGVHFIKAIESTRADIIRPAIRGLTAIGDVSKLPRLRDLTTQEDVAVRLAAVEAVGRLGRDDADAECLLGRLSDASEPARDAAWIGLERLLAARPLAEQLEWSDRLRELPDYQLRFLVALEKDLAIRNGETEYLDVLRRRLALLLTARGKDAEAVRYLRSLYESLSRRGDPAAFDAGIALLEAMLAGRLNRDLAAIVRQLATGAPDEAARGRIVETVRVYVDAEETAADVDRTRGLLAHFDGSPIEGLGEAWTALLARLRDRVEPDETESPSESAPQP